MKEEVNHIEEWGNLKISRCPGVRVQEIFSILLSNPDYRWLNIKMEGRNNLFSLEIEGEEWEVDQLASELGYLEGK